jgi:hypothetical protein
MELPCFAVVADSRSVADVVLMVMSRVDGAVNQDGG